MRDKDIADRKLAKADPKAKELVNAIQSILAGELLDLIALKTSLIELLEYLSSKMGRTDENCRAVDSFFMLDNRWVERNLPDPFHAIFADIAGALHDTVSAPDIAENFDSIPEQLLTRVRKLNTEQPHPLDRR